MGNVNTVVERHLRKTTEGLPLTRKTIGSKGGILAVKGHGVTLNIPPGSLTGNTDMKVQFLGEELPEEFTTKDEVSLCPSVRCTPSGMTFIKPVQLTLNHCAELTEQVFSGVSELVLYSREINPDGAGDQTITRTQLAPPLCEFFKDRVLIHVKELCDFWIRIKPSFCRGKRVGCLPFVPIVMPRTRNPILRVYVYDLTEGHNERITKEETHFGFKHPLIPEGEMLVKPTGTDLQIVVKDKRRQEFRKTITYDNVLHLERNIIYVELDYSKKPENELNISIDVFQEERNKADANRSSLQFRTVLQAAKRVVIDDDESDSKSKKKKRLESIDDDPLFLVADEIENEEALESLMQALDIGPVARRRCLETNRSEGKVTNRGTRDMLISWRAKTEAAEQTSSLKSALSKAELEDLSTRVFQEEEKSHYRNL